MNSFFELSKLSYYSLNYENEKQIGQNFDKLNLDTYFSILNKEKPILRGYIIELYDGLFYIEYKIKDIIIFESEKKSYYDIYKTENIHENIIESASKNEILIFKKLNDFFTIYYIL